ncbi:MAG: 23S rRNA pseudouridine(955/2504/2580) synthase RluC [Buchnera aphidicola (Floraphis meitanensis)]
MINKMLPVSFLYITKENTEQRIDNFLRHKFKTLPKSTIYKILRTGQVRINKNRVKPKYKLQIRDHIRIPPIENINIKEKNIKLNKKLFSLLSNNILYEDNYLLILNKPAGIAVHSGSGINFGIIECFRELLHRKSMYLDLVHRLDRGTSGALIIAKKRSILRELHKQLREKKIQKEYLALVHGHWPQHLKYISAPLLKTRSNNDHIVKVSNIHGKFSKTYFKIKKKYTNNTLMSVIPITGRTHQIRVHAKYANHPIVLDKKYGNIDLDNVIKNNFCVKRLLLHASSITFFHPKQKELINIVAPIDKEFTTILNNLSKN